MDKEWWRVMQSLKSDAKFEEKLTLSSKKWHDEFGEF